MNETTIERAFLGALIGNARAVRALAGELRASAFEDDGLATVFEALVELARHERAVDVEAIASELEARGQLAVVGGAARLRELTHAPDVGRARAAIGARLAEAAYPANEDFPEDVEPEGPSAAAGALKEMLRTFERTRTGELLGLSTGFPGLDHLTLGLRPGELWIVGGAPLRGKTAFALNVATQLALQKDRPAVLLATPRLAKPEVGRRVACMLGRVAESGVRGGVITRRDEECLLDACELLAGSQLLLDDTFPLTTEGLVAKARAARARRELDVIVLDHLEALDGADETARTRRRELAGRSAVALSALARELDVPILAMADLRQPGEPRGPEFRDFSAPSAVMRSAAVVAFLSRPAYYLSRETAERAGIERRLDVVLEHNRLGPLGEVALDLDSVTGRLTEPVP